MIKVGQLAIVKRQVFQVAVIRILLNENDVFGAHGFEDAIRNRSLARPGAAADTDDQIYSFIHKSWPISDLRLCVFAPLRETSLPTLHTAPGTGEFSRKGAKTRKTRRVNQQSLLARQSHDNAS